MFKSTSCMLALALALLGAAACGAGPDDPAPAADPDPGAPDALTPELRMAVEASLDHLGAHAGVRGLGGRGELRLVRAFVDELDLTHTRFQQTVGGVPVFGGEGIVHLRRDRSIAAVTDAFVPNLTVSTAPALTADQAIARALPAGTCATCLAAPPAADLWALRHEGRDHLAWRVQLRLGERTSRISLPVVFVDAHTGEIVWQYDNLQTGSGPSLYSGSLAFETTPAAGLYYMEDLPRRLGTFDLGATADPSSRFLDPDDLWDAASQRAGIDAHHGAAMAWEYYRSVHGRDGIDGVGGPGAALAIDGTTPLIASFVHYGTSYNNAFWDGAEMAYGDGDGVGFSPLVSLDVVGHEMTHGVTQYTAGLVYSGESGALNESYSDIFGALVERHARGDSEAIWKLGDECYTPSIPGDALRDMESPHRASNKGYTADDDPDHYSERYLGGEDNGGVHINSGIANKTFYLLAMGGAHHLGGSMTGIGPDKAAAIWYKALTAYMTSSTGFARAGKATYDAAVALYGAGSLEAAAVESAWGLTGIVVDRVAPETALTAPTSGATVAGLVTLAASASDNVAVTGVEFLVDGVVRGSDSTSPFTYAWRTAPADVGPHTLASRAYDAAGNSSQSAPVAVTVAAETVPPSVAITAPAAGATVAGAVAVTVAATDNTTLTRVELYVDGAYLGSDTAAPYSFAWSSLAVGNGTHGLSATAFDVFGNSATSAAVSVVVDNDRTPPVVAITTPATGTTAAGVLYVSIDATDNRGVTRVELLVDGAVIATDTAASWQFWWDTAASGNGTHALVARAYDAANNVASSTAVSVTANNPGMAVYDPALRAPRCGTTGKVCDTGNLVTGRASLGPEPNAPNTLGGACPDGTSGTYHVNWSLDRLRVSTFDGLPIAAGKEIQIEATVWGAPDTTAGYNGVLDLYHTATPATPVWTLIGSHGAWGDGSNTLFMTFTLPAGAQHAIRGQFRSVNEGPASEPCVVSGSSDHDDLVFAAVNAPDTAPPTVTLTEPTAGATLIGTAVVRAAVTDDIGVVAVELYVDGAKIATDTTAPYDFVWNTNVVPNGSRTLQVLARDVAGHVGQSAPVTVTVRNPDSTPPVVSITSPEPGATVAGTWSVAIAASDPAGINWVELAVDGATVGYAYGSPYTIAWNASLPPNGPHVLVARAVDTTGNAASSAPITVTVAGPDVTPPTTAITSPAAGATVADTVAVTTASSDNIGVAAVELLLDGKVIATSVAAPWSFAWDTRATTNKSHTLRTRARDTSGNTTLGATITVTVANSHFAAAATPAPARQVTASGR